MAQALANGKTNSNLRSISWWFHFDPYPFVGFDSGKNVLAVPPKEVASLRVPCLLGPLSHYPNGFLSITFHLCLCSSASFKN